MGCMTDKGDNIVCPNCGLNEEELKNASQNFLQPNSRLNDRYTVGIALGQGGFGITYIGYDNILNTRVAIKEYYPSDSSQRVPESQTVMAYAGSESDFERGKQKFLDEARTLAKFSGYPGVVMVRDCFDANGTAYMVMQYLDGMDLKQYIKRCGGMLSEQESVKILMPIIEVLKEIHKTGIIHRDISPDNIFMTNDGDVKLIDFGAARQSFGGNKSLSVTLKPGYAPEEQYRTRGNQGSWTDVYALSATLYKMVTGKTPPESIERVMDDELVIPDNLSDNIRFALKKGMAVRASERFVDMSELQAAITDGEQGVKDVLKFIHKSETVSNTMSIKDLAFEDAQNVKMSEMKGRNKTVLISVLSATLALCVIAVAVFVFAVKNNENRALKQAETQTASTDAGGEQKTNTQTKSTDETVSLKDLYNLSYTYKRMYGIENSELVTSKYEYDKIKSTISEYYTVYSSFVENSNGSEQDFKNMMSGCLKIGSKAYESQFAYYQKHNISYYELKSMDIKCIRKAQNMYYVWDKEVINEVKSGISTMASENWVYLIEKENESYFITDYISDPSVQQVTQKNEKNVDRDADENLLYTTLGTNLNAYVNGVNTGDTSAVSGYIDSSTDFYRQEVNQIKSYHSQGVRERLISYNVVKVEWIDDDSCYLTQHSVIEVNRNGKVKNADETYTYLMRRIGGKFYYIKPTDR